MASLYDINQDIIDCIDLTTGEILDLEKLESLQLERDTKIENIALWYKNLLSDAAAYKAEKENFADKEKSATNKAASLKKYLDMSLDGKKFTSTKVNISYRKSSTLEYDGTTKIPEEYLKQVEPKIDNTAVKNDIKNGKEIEGFTIKDHHNIQIK